MALLFTNPAHVQRARRSWRQTAASLAMVCLISVPTLALASKYVGAPMPGAPGTDPALAKPTKWIGTRFPLLDYVTMSESLANGRWSVLLYRRDCPLCDAAVRRFTASHARTGAATSPSRTALLEVPPLSASGARERNCPHCSYGSLDEGHDWLLPTPVHVVLVNGLVIDVEMPSEMSGGNAPSG